MITFLFRSHTGDGIHRVTIKLDFSFIVQRNKMNDDRPTREDLDHSNYSLTTINLVPY